MCEDLGVGGDGIDHLTVTREEGTEFCGSADLVLDMFSVER